jgi:hypothetical protein
VARTIRELGDLVIARARLGRQGARRGSPLEEITDGDTPNVELEGDHLADGARAHDLRVVAPV